MMGLLITWTIWLAVISYWMIKKKPLLRQRKSKERLERLKRRREIDQIGKE